MNFKRDFSVDDGSEECFSLGERGWRSYLAAVDFEVFQALKLFTKSRHVVNHLDLMMSVVDLGKIAARGDLGSFKNSEIETFHRHPINIISRAIFIFIEKIWNIGVAKSKAISAEYSLDLAKLMCSMQEQMLYGITSLDACEYSLGICHFKKAITEVSRSLFFAKKLLNDDEQLKSFVDDFSIALFDLRDLAWQGISLCNSGNKKA